MAEMHAYISLSLNLANMREGGGWGRAAVRREMRVLQHLQ